MVIVCPSCVSTYRIEPEVLRSAQPLQCAHCGGAIEPADRLAPKVLPPSDDRRPSGLLVGRPEPLSARTALARSPLPAGVRSTLSLHPAVVFGAVLIIGTAAIGWRQAIASAFPATTPLYAAISLPTGAPLPQIKDIHTALIQDGGADVLTLEASLANDRTVAIQVPAIRVVIRDNADQSLYTWIAEPPKQRLAAGEAVAFKTRLVTPPANGHDLLLEFADDGRERHEVTVKDRK